ncbi:hypothetical protein Scep_025948 [Stephania cephalantha]|uniref:Uncharacterized protein n=1 Tax=Stephania cephalantha TaxID=152367 RepID=A0AAP0ET33_9MAGN
MVFILIYTPTFDQNLFSLYLPLRLCRSLYPPPDPPLPPHPPSLSNITLYSHSPSSSPPTPSFCLIAFALIVRPSRLWRWIGVGGLGLGVWPKFLSF